MNPPVPQSFATTSFPFGPWPSGIDNRHAPSHRVFQLPGEGGSQPHLVAVTNLDLDAEGWPRTRPETETLFVLPSCVGAWNAAGRLFVQSAGSLYETTATGNTLLVSGFSRRVALCEHWGRVYVTDGEHHVELTDTVAQNWGLPVPEVTATAVAGGRDLGTYLARVAFMDAVGNEGGASDAVVVTGTGVQLAVSGATSAVVSATIYLSRANQPIPSYCETVPIGGFPRFVLAEPTVGDPPKTMQMTGPIASAAGIASYRAFLLMWRDNVIFRSEAGEPHLFHGDNILQFDATVTTCEGMTGGIWVGTSQGLWWVSGDDPANWVPQRKTHEAVAVGSARIQGKQLPSLNLGESRIALFVAENGLLAATEQGEVIPLTADRYRFTMASRYGFTYVERDDLKQILVVGAN